MHKILVLLLLFAAAPLRAEVHNIDDRQLAELIARGVPLVDIRRPDEWRQTGVIKGSHLLTFFDAKGRYDINAWLRRFRRIAGKDDPVILICRTGHRSAVVSHFLDEKVGYRKVYNVTRGITDWIRKGHPVVAPQR